MKYLIIIGLVTGLLTGCHNKRTSTPDESFRVDEIDSVDQIEDYSTYNDMDTVGYYGVFEGMTAPNSRTVKAKLTLYDNNRYIIHSVDLDDDTKTEEEEGTYLIFGDLLTLTPDHNGTEQYYKTNDEHLIPLDDQKQEIKGIHSENLRLVRTPD
ncbi:MAG: copper resistance protein NlpE [Tannerellaceae bacterium]|nr:copper resistance protein NlpE [Tannerellaceae bacterium]